MRKCHLKNSQNKKKTYLSDKDPKEQQCDVPCEEEEGGTDPEVVEQGEVQQSSDAVERMDGAAEEDHTKRHLFLPQCEKKGPRLQKAQNI